MSLIKQLRKDLGDGVRSVTGNMKHKWDKDVKAYTKKMKSQGRKITGYETLNYGTPMKAGRTKRHSYQVPIFSDKPQKAVAAKSKAVAKKKSKPKLKDVTLSDQAKAINKTVSDWESGAGDYIRDESPFAKAAREAYEGTGDQTPEVPGVEKDVDETTDKQKEAQDFMNSYKDALKGALFAADHEEVYE